MGTLYVVGAPAGDLDDLTHRARRILSESALVVAEDEDHARQLLDHHGVTTPLAAPPVDAHLEALETGDLALLCSGLSPAPTQAGTRLVSGALARGCPVVPAPGPSLPVTALIISGFPADSFLYLGEVPRDPSTRRELLKTVREERCSLLVLVPHAILPAVLADLPGTLGDRPLALVSTATWGAELVWRGRSAEALDGLAGMESPCPYVLVIGGAPDGTVRWEEGRLQAEIQSQQAAGLRDKEISQKLAQDSGWSRREIYRMCLQIARRNSTQGEKPDGK